MESVGAFPDVEWDSIMRMLNADQGFDSFGQYPFSHDHDDNFVMSSCSSLAQGGPTSGLQYIYQDTSLGSGCSSTRVSAPTSSAECYYFNDGKDVGITNNVTYMSGEKCSFFSLPYPNISMEEPARVDESHDTLGNPCDGQLKRKFDLNTANLSENPKKKPRASKAVQKCPKSNKTKKVVTNGKDEEESDVVHDRQSSSSCSSEDDIELNRAEPETPLKTRASRGSATDPQSLYARKRREKINERLKVLQNLVPNGTKVDISTMLEEAVDYVKFLQLQIKLLSSDDMWMYAPIAYNGMDLGLNGKMSPASL